MAISLVGSFEDGVLNGGNPTLTMPGGIAQNDVVYIAYGEGATADLNLSVSTAGYTELADLRADDSSDCNLGVYRKVQGSTPDSSVVCTGSGNAANGTQGIAFVLRGVDTTTPEDATIQTATGINTEVADPPSITTVTNGAWVLAIAGASDATAGDISAAPTNYSDLVWGRANDNNDMVIGVARREIAVAGAENPGSFSGHEATGTASWCAATVAVRPAAGDSSFVFSPPPASFISHLVR